MKEDKTVAPGAPLPEYRHALSARDGYMWKGMEFPNPVPQAPPLGYKKQPSLMDNIRDMIRRASEEAAHQGFETEEEADDFEVGDDYDPMDRTTPWEAHFHPGVQEALLPRQAPSKPVADPPRGGSDRPPAPPHPMSSDATEDPPKGS